MRSAPPDIDNLINSYQIASGKQRDALVFLLIARINEISSVQEPFHLFAAITGFLDATTHSFDERTTTIARDACAKLFIGDFDSAALTLLPLLGVENRETTASTVQGIISLDLCGKLSDKGKTEVTKRIVKRLDQDLAKTEYERRRSFFILRNLDVPRARPLLETLTIHPDHEVRHLAAQTILEKGLCTALESSTLAQTIQEFIVDLYKNSSNTQNALEKAMDRHKVRANSIPGLLLAGLAEEPEEVLSQLGSLEWRYAYPTVISILETMVEVGEHQTIDEGEWSNQLSEVLDSSKEQTGRLHGGYIHIPRLALDHLEFEACKALTLPFFDNPTNRQAVAEVLGDAALAQHPHRGDDETENIATAKLCGALEMDANIRLLFAGFVENAVGEFSDRIDDLRRWPGFDQILSPPTDNLDSFELDR